MKSFQFYTLSLIVFLLCLYSSANGQSIPNQYSADLSILPPSPNAASLAKYAEIPVNMHTGTPQISIPVTSLLGYQLSTDVSISYHSGGIKVADFGSWVGLGWSLNAGGIITRSVRGLPDEIRNSNTPRGYLHLPFHPENLWDINNNQDETQQKVAAGKYDGQPDEFSFNFGGYAGSFVMRRNKGTGEVEPILLSYQELKIKRIPPVFREGAGYYGDGNANWADQKWEIITPNGTRYIFGIGKNFEKTQSHTTYYSTGHVLI
ncbi:hypothetical protein ACE193_18365 [Bernardetia sp. OM2101]|uniref:hypothetical protein n=1 Tax=Bernardetia sp. OM2101 TaxID=3344876 RepID=UPI0035CF58ED